MGFEICMILRQLVGQENEIYKNRLLKNKNKILHAQFGIIMHCIACYTFTQTMVTTDTVFLISSAQLCQKLSYQVLYAGTLDHICQSGSVNALKVKPGVALMPRVQKVNCNPVASVPYLLFSKKACVVQLFIRNIFLNP